MINRKELEICKVRGHDPQGYNATWERCKYCGMWTRMVKEESEDEPPEDEQNSLYRLQAKLDKDNAEAAKKLRKGKR
jgi:hypothetical protein